MAESGNFLDKVANAKGGNIDLKGQMTSAAKGALPGAAGSLVDKVASNEIVSGALSKVEGMVQQGLSAIQSAAGGILGNSLQNISQMFPSGVSDIFSAINPTAGPLSTFAGDLTKGKKETDSLLKSFGASATEAINNPVAFISKPVNDVIKGVDTTVQGGVNTATAAIPASTMANLSAASGVTVTDNASANKAVYAITNTFASQANNTQFGSSPYIEPSVSSGQTYSSSLIAGMSATLASNRVEAPTDLGMSDNTLPASYQDMLAGNSTTAVAKVTNSYLTKKADGIKSIQRKFSSSNSDIDTDDITSTLLGFSGNYPQVTTNTGQSTTNLYGNNSSDTITQFYKLAKEICNGINIPNNTYKMSENKDLFDLLLTLCANLGLSDLLKQLMNCGKSIQDLFDKRSSDLLKDYLMTAAVNGSVYMVATIVEGIGSYAVSSPEQTMMILNANMADDTQSLSAYEDLSTTLNITPQSIVTETVAGKSAYNSDKVAMMSVSNTTVIDSAIGANNRKLTAAAKSTYSSGSASTSKKASIYTKKSSTTNSSKSTARNVGVQMESISNAA